MSTDALTLIPLALAIIVGAYFVVRVFWIAMSAYKLSRAGPRLSSGAYAVLWRDPGAVERLDLVAGPGGRETVPVPPYRFIEEHASGSQPCVSVHDAYGRRWRVKWGHEVRSETFAVRLAWACGYFAEVTHFVPTGRIEGAGPLTRASASIDESGAFADARFELDDPAVEKLFAEHSWSWTDNPFVGTRELAGLKVLLMLISNWDNKDQRDVGRGSNTAIYLTPVSRGRRDAQYLIVDWGGSMGRWGQTVITRGRWDPDGFAAQTAGFVTGVEDGFVQFGYTGQRTADARANIRVEDVAWLCDRLARITDPQLHDALRASGATGDEALSFTASLRARIDQLVEAGRAHPRGHRAGASEHRERAREAERAGEAAAHFTHGRVVGDDASEHRERARGAERAGEAASQRRGWGVRGAKPLG
jgi:hypothetical protein